MNSKIFAILVIISLITVIPTAYAQVTIADKANQKLVEVRIDTNDNVYVKHIIEDSKTPKQVNLISGEVSNVVVTSENGKEVQFSIVGDNNAVLILPSNEDSILEYELDNVLSKINGVSTWDFVYLETTSFILPNEINFLFVNERPVYLGEMKGINCHGCQMLIEYTMNEIETIENIKWNDKKFLVEITSNANIDKFTFDQPTKSITFNVKEENRFVNTIIPLELLWGPYSVSLNDKKILFQEYFNNGTHVWVTTVPETSGKITIIGTTVVPEFSIMLPLIIGFFVILALPFMKKFNLH